MLDFWCLDFLCIFMLCVWYFAFFCSSFQIHESIFIFFIWTLTVCTVNLFLQHPVTECVFQLEIFRRLLWFKRFLEGLWIFTRGLGCRVFLLTCHQTKFRLNVRKVRCRVASAFQIFGWQPIPPYVGKLHSGEVRKIFYPYLFSSLFRITSFLHSSLKAVSRWPHIKKTIPTVEAHIFVLKFALLRNLIYKKEWTVNCVIFLSSLYPVDTINTTIYSA